MRKCYKSFLSQRFILFLPYLIRYGIALVVVWIPSSSFSATYYTRGAGGDWSNIATWSLSCNGAIAGTVPGAADDVVICASNGGAAVVVTVDAPYACNNLTIGDANFDATVQITNPASSLSVNGALALNTSNNNNFYTLDAGPGTISVNGTFSWGTLGANRVLVSSGSVTFVPPISQVDNNQWIVYSGAGTINFNGGFTCNRTNTRFITVPNCTAIFRGTYTQTTNNLTWDVASTAIFDCNPCAIDNTTGRTDFGHVIIFDNAVVSTSGADFLNITSDLTLNNNSTFNVTKNIPGNISVARSINNITLNSGSTFNLGGAGTFIQSSGNWINNGGTLNGGTYTVRFEGIGNSIGGTTTTNFPTIQIGNTLNGVNYTLDQNITCTNLIFDVDNQSRTLTHSAANSLTVTGNVTMNQSNGNVTNLWDIAGGSATIAGNLNFVGTNNTLSRITKVNVSSGSLTLNGNVTWMANTGVATEEISLGSGVITFANSLSMPQRSGTLNVTGSGTVNFNGTSAPSFDLNQTNGGLPNAVFSTSFGSIINFNNGFTNTNAAVVLADGSTSIFTGNGTIIPAAPITFGNVQINAGVAATFAGNISVTNDWTNLGGTFIPATFTVTFNGLSTQTITNATGETFYNLTTNTTGPLTLANDVTVNNALTMTTGDYNLNGNTLTLGNAAASTLSRTAGIMYGGTFRRWWLAGTPVTSTSGNYYGLFPIGTSSDYRPIAIASTVNPTGAGYVLASHTDAITATDINFNEPPISQRKHDMTSILAVSGLTGGTYSLNVSFTALASIGVLTDMRLLTYTGGIPGAVGAHAVATGTVPAPTVRRTGLTSAQLANNWVISTINRDPVLGTPLRQPYYSRRTGNWNDATAGNATWSFTAGGAGPSCDCVPTAGALVVISSGHTVTLNANAAPDYLIIEDAASLIGTSNLTVGYDIRVDGTGGFTPTAGTWIVSRNVTFTGASVSSTTPFATTVVSGNLSMAAGSLLTLNQNLTVNGNISIDGTISSGTRILLLNGINRTISGIGAINSTTGRLDITTGNKIVSAGSDLTISAGSPTTLALLIVAGITVTNNGNVTISGNLTGSAAASTWTNAANSTLNITGSLLATGTLNASASSNTVNYNGGGAQTIKATAAGYYNLTLSNAGIKTSPTLSINGGTLTVQDAAIFFDNGNNITGTGGLTMSGTSEYRTTVTNGLQLSGTYNLIAGTVNFNRSGNQNVRGLNIIPAAYFNVMFSGAGTKTLLGNITVQNNLTIAGTNTRLDVDLVSGNNYNITLAGNWSVTATTVGDHFNERVANGTVILNGSTQQIIDWGTDNTRTFNNLSINNSTPASAILMNSPSVVSKQLDLIDGHIVNGNNTLTMGAGGSVALSATPQDSSFVKGRMAHTVNVNAAVTKIFPVGKDNDYRRADVLIDQAAATTTTYTTEMINSSARALGYTVPGTLRWVSDVRYHTITQSPSTGLDAAQVWLYFSCSQKNDVVQDLPNLRIAQWDNTTTWVDRGASTNFGTLCDGVNYAGFVMSDPFTTFTGNKFALSDAVGGGNPLPVTLVSFEANTNENKVDLKWITATEVNNDYFTVEKSTDATNWEKVLTRIGANNSNVNIEYFDTDYQPYEGISYYRLKQTDFDGTYTYSNTVPVKFERKVKQEINLFPNPVVKGGNVNIQFSEIIKNNVLIVIRDIKGQEFYSKANIRMEDNQLVAIPIGSEIPSGFYIITATSENQIYSQKLLVK